MRSLITHSLLALLTLLAGVATVLVPTAAEAAPSVRTDPRDTQGDLDLKRVALRSSGPRIVATISTYAAFTRDDLDSANSLQLHFRVAPQRTRRVLVQWLNDGLVATVYTRRSSSPVSRSCSDVRVKRLSRTAVRVVVPRAKIDRGAKVFRWRAGSTAWTRTAGCTTAPYCEDLLPDRGTYLRWRP